MSDGPFRNLELHSAWKHYGEQLVRDAASPEERTRQVYYSMLSDLDLPRTRDFLTILEGLVSAEQRNLDAIAVEVAFSRCPVSPLRELLRRQVLADHQDQTLTSESLYCALRIAVVEWVSRAENRLVEQCLNARDLGDMPGDSYTKSLTRNHATFGSISIDVLCDAIKRGDKRAFARSRNRKSGLDDGPDE